MNALPILIVTVCVLTIGYRYYSAFIAARVMALDGSRQTPAHLHNDGSNYHPTGKWVLFGHHFAVGKHDHAFRPQHPSALAQK